MFIGQYNHQMDDKGRLRIPPVFRRALGDNPMIFCNYFEKNIWIFPREDFNETVWDRFKSYDMLDEEMNDVMRIVFSMTQELSEDKQGRVSLMSSFIETCGLTKDITTIGVRDHIEIWDAKKYDEHIKSRDFKTILAQLQAKRNQI